MASLNNGSGSLVSVLRWQHVQRCPLVSRHSSLLSIFINRNSSSCGTKKQFLQIKFQIKKIKFQFKFFQLNFRKIQETISLKSSIKFQAQTFRSEPSNWALSILPYFPQSVQNIMPLVGWTAIARGSSRLSLIIVFLLKTKTSKTHWRNFETFVASKLSLFLNYFQIFMRRKQNCSFHFEILSLVNFLFTALPLKVAMFRSVCFILISHFNSDNNSLHFTIRLDAVSSSNV